MDNWDEQAPVVAELPEIKLFGKWSTEDVQVSDISLTVSPLESSFKVSDIPQNPLYFVLLCKNKILKVNCHWNFFYLNVT